MALIPDYNPVQQSGSLGASQSVGAAAAPGQGLQQVGQGVSDIGQGVATWQAKKQKAVDVGAKASVRLAVAQARADHELFRQKNPDKEDEWVADYQNRIGGIRSALPTDISGDATFEIDNELSTYEEVGSKEVEGLAQVQGVKRARMAVDTAADAFVKSGQADSAEKQIREGEGTLYTPEEVAAKVAKIKPEAQAYEAEMMMNRDPFLIQKAITEKDKDGKFVNFPDLDPGRRGTLARQAESRVSEIRSERFNTVMTETLSGNWLQKSDALDMAKRGEWSYGQAYSYLNQLESFNKRQQPEHDNSAFNSLHTDVMRFDPKTDETGRMGADMAATIMASPLSPQHKSELMGQLTERQKKAPSLSGDKDMDRYVADKIDERFKAGQFGTFKIKKESEEGSGEFVEVQDQAAWERANAKRYDVMKDVQTFLKTTNETDRKKVDAALDAAMGISNQRPNPYRFTPKEGASRIDKVAPVKKADDGSTSYNLPAPLKAYEGTFLEAAKLNNLDPAFLMAVAMHETGGGTSSAFKVKRNAMGVSNSSGPISFEKVEDSIFRQAKTLANPNGPYKGARTIAEIGAVYAPSNADNDPKDLNKFWPNGVAKFYKELRGSGSATSFVASRDGAARFPGPQRIEQIDTRGKSWSEVQGEYWDKVGGGAVGDVAGELSALRQQWAETLVATAETKPKGKKSKGDLPSGPGEMNPILLPDVG